MKKHLKNFIEYVTENINETSQIPPPTNDKLSKDIYTIPELKSGMSLNISSPEMNTLKSELTSIINMGDNSLAQLTTETISHLMGGSTFKNFDAIIEPIINSNLQKKPNQDIVVDFSNNTELNNLIDDYISRIEKSTQAYKIEKNKYATELQNTIVKALRPNFIVIPIFQTGLTTKYNTTGDITLIFKTKYLNNNGKSVKIKIYENGKPIDFRNYLKKWRETPLETIDPTLVQDMLQVLSLGKQ